MISAIDSYDIVTELNNGAERAVKATFQLTMDGYLIPENIQKDTASIKKYSDKSYSKEEKYSIPEDLIYSLFLE